MGRKDIGNIVEIMKNDFHSAFSNPIVTIVLIAIVILPSLYALLNVQACWDPYENTGNIEFPIANLDEGATFEGQQINIGNELVKELKKNDNFDWKFVTEDELRDGVYKGDYYAGIVIPKNLSKNIVSITGDDPQQAKLEYLVNIKSNPVGSKISTTGANTVYMNLNSKIVEIINLAAYGKLGELQEGLASGAGQLASGGDQLSNGVSQLEDGGGKLQDGASEVKDASSKVKDGANEVKKGKTSVDEGAKKIDEGSKVVESGAQQLDQGAEELDSVVDPSLMPEGPVKEYVEGSSKVAKGSTSLADGSVQLANGSVELAKGSTKLADGSGKVADGASQLADGSAELADGSLALAAGAELLGNGAAQALYTAAGSLGSTANMLGELTGLNETILGDYIYSPIKLDKHEIFPVPNFGSDVSPFYIVLSMWVGALITCVMIEPKSSAGTKYSPFEMYAGKLLFYISLSILQACVTIIGSYLLGIYIVDDALFIFSAIVISVVFMVLIYSIISAVGNVGKGIAVILLVLQISATGGIYAIEIMHPFFRTLYPYLPMTYAIRVMREAQLGTVWANYIPSLIFIVALGIITVIVALIIKEKADKASKYFEEKLEESGLF